MINQLDRILNFVKRTADKAILFKNDGEYVVMRLSDYENLLDEHNKVEEMTEGELLNKINREIAIWHQSQAELSAKVNESDPAAPFADSPYYDSLSNVPSTKDVNQFGPDIIGIDNTSSEPDDADWHDDWHDDFNDGDSNNFNYYEEKQGSNQVDSHSPFKKEDNYNRDPFDFEEGSSVDADFEEDKTDEQNDFKRETSSYSSSSNVFNSPSKEKVKKVPVKSKQSSSPKKINNFGYTNPNDTPDEYSKIAPPPPLQDKNI